MNDKSNGRYILIDGEPVEEPDLMKWGQWMEDNHLKRHVADDKIGDVRVSTVFLGLNHNFGEEGPPILYETMIFDGAHHGYEERYSTRSEAIEGHAKALVMVKGKKP